MLVGLSLFIYQMYWACHQSRPVKPFATSKGLSFPSEKQKPLEVF